MHILARVLGISNSMINFGDVIWHVMSHEALTDLTGLTFQNFRFQNVLCTILIWFIWTCYCNIMTMCISWASLADNKDWLLIKRYIASQNWKWLVMIYFRPVGSGAAWRRSPHQKSAVGERERKGREEPRREERKRKEEKEKRKEKKERKREESKTERCIMGVKHPLRTGKRL